jgi:hypothetical protein
MTPGTIERRTHDYVRHGTTTLFAAFNVADGTVIGQTQRRHRAAEFKAFLTRIDKTVPAGLDIHLVIDNYAAPQNPRDQGLAGRAPTRPLPLHPDRLLLDQPGRALVRLPHHATPPPQRPPQRHRPRSRSHRPDRELEHQPEALRVDQDRRRDPRITHPIDSAYFWRKALGRVSKV